MNKENTTLTYKCYELVSEPDSDRFDLYKNTTVEVKAKGVKTGETKPVRKLIGYSFHLEGAVNWIATDAAKENLFDTEDLERLMTAMLGTARIVGAELLCQLKAIRNELKKTNYNENNTIKINNRG